MPVGMANRTNGNDPVGRAEVADYVATITADLAAMAREHRLDALGHLLDMAHLEAEEVVRRSRHAK